MTSFLQGVLDGDRSAFAWLDGPNRAVSMRAVTAWVQVLPTRLAPAGAGPAAVSMLQLRHWISARVVVAVNLRVDTSYEDVGATDLLVEVRDANGQRSVVRIGALAPVASQVIWPTEATGFALDDWSPITSVRIPLDSIVSVNPSLDIARLERLELHGTNRPWLPLWVDDVSFDG